MCNTALFRAPNEGPDNPCTGGYQSLMMKLHAIVKSLLIQVLPLLLLILMLMMLLLLILVVSSHGVFLNKMEVAQILTMTSSIIRLITSHGDRLTMTQSGD